MSALANPETGESVPTITRDEAMRLTAEIKGHAGQIWRLLSKAHETKAYLALDFPTFEQYVEVEFEMSKSQAYRLLDKARIVADLNAGMIAASWNVADGESPIGDIPETHARELVPLLGHPEKVAEAYIAAHEATDGAPTAVAIKVEVDKRTDSPSPAVQAARERRAREAEAAAVRVELREVDGEEQYVEVTNFIALRDEAHTAIDPLAASLQAIDFPGLVEAFNNGDEIDKAYLPDFATVLRSTASRIEDALKPGLRSV